MDSVLSSPGLMEITITVTRTVEGLGERIYALRKADKRALGMLATEAGMSAENWRRIEKEQQTVPFETLKKMEAALGVSLELGELGPEAQEKAPSSELEEGADR